MQATELMEDILYQEDYIMNSRGLKLFTCKWLPKDQEPKGLIFICHGFAMECSITMNSSAIRFGKAGFAVYGIDYEGHGKSGGLPGYIEKFQDIVDDCCNHFTNISEMEENKGKTRFLLGESMGGAVAILLHRMKPDFWDGAILIAPMCKIAKIMKPNPIVVKILNNLCRFIPTWKIIPAPDIIEVGFKQPEIRHLIRTNPYCYKGKTRLKTGNELLRVSEDIEKRLDEVSFPFIVFHGEADQVTEISGSKQLHIKATSMDKTLKTYPGMWHGLLYGETLENIEIIFKDIVSWLEERSGQDNLRLERQQKMRCDDNLKTKQQ